MKREKDNIKWHREREAIFRKIEMDSENQHKPVLEEVTYQMKLVTYCLKYHTYLYSLINVSI